MLKGKCVVLGVTGGIAAYKAAEVASRLVKMGCEVVPVLTRNGARFIPPLTLESISNSPAIVDTFERPRTWEIEHISLAKRANLFIIAPATANFIGKVASGICDDMLTTTVCATKAPMLIAPAMNEGMWTNAFVQRNMGILKEQGVFVIGPEYGRFAESSSGVGRMSEPVQIAEAAVRLLCPKRDMEGLHIAVTAGPTREAIDPVRYITNHSSGKMGYAIAEAAHRRGARVTLITGPVSLAAPQGVERVPIETTEDLMNAVMGVLPSCDALIQAAAPADYRAKSVSERKLKKTGEGMTLELMENPDVAAAAGKLKREGQVLVIFAAETGDGLSNARAKMVRKNADLVVLNDVTLPGAGFNADTNIATLIDQNGETEMPIMPKAELADRILDKVMALRQ